MYGQSSSGLMVCPCEPQTLQIREVLGQLCWRCPMLQHRLQKGVVSWAGVQCVSGWRVKVSCWVTGMMMGVVEVYLSATVTDGKVKMSLPEGTGLICRMSCVSCSMDRIVEAVRLWRSMGAMLEWSVPG